MIEAAHKDALRERAAAAAKLQEAHDVIVEMRALLSEERNKCSKVQQQTHTHHHPQPSSPAVPAVLARALVCPQQKASPFSFSSPKDNENSNRACALSLHFISSSCIVCLRPPHTPNHRASNKTHTYRLTVHLAAHSLTPLFPRRHLPRRCSLPPKNTKKTKKNTQAEDELREGEKQVQSKAEEMQALRSEADGLREKLDQTFAELGAAHDLTRIAEGKAARMASRAESAEQSAAEVGSPESQVARSPGPQVPSWFFIRLDLRVNWQVHACCFSAV